MDFRRNGVELVKRMQAKGDIENSKTWIMLDHVKHLKDWMTIACHVYNTKYCEVLTIVCCDMQTKDSVAQR